MPGSANDHIEWLSLVNHVEVYPLAKIYFDIILFSDTKRSKELVEHLFIIDFA